MVIILTPIQHLKTAVSLLMMFLLPHRRQDKLVGVFTPKPLRLGQGQVSVLHFVKVELQERSDIMLYILTNEWVLCNPFTGQNMFQYRFCIIFVEKKIENCAKAIKQGFSQILALA